MNHATGTGRALNMVAVAFVALAACKNEPQFFRVKQMGDKYVVSGQGYAISADFPAMPKITQVETPKLTVNNAELIVNNDYVGIVCFSAPSGQLDSMASHHDLFVDAMRMQLQARGMTVKTDRPLTGNGHVFEGPSVFPQLQNQSAYTVVQMFIARKLQKVCQLTAASVGATLSASAQQFIASAVINDQ